MGSLSEVWHPFQNSVPEVYRGQPRLTVRLPDGYTRRGRGRWRD